MADTTSLSISVLARLSALEYQQFGSVNAYSDTTDFERSVLARLVALEISKFGSGAGVPDPTTFTREVIDRLNALESGGAPPPPPPLGALTLSSTSFTVGASLPGTINGATSHSTITASGLPAGLTIDGPARTFQCDGTGTASTGSFTLTETLTGAVGSPRTSIVNYTISTATGSLTISTVPTITGAAVVGQTVYATSGTYNATPDSVTPTWTVGGTTITDATGDSLLVTDIYAGLPIGYSEIARKSGYTDSASNAATATAAVANINLANAITALTRTSASGVLPMTADITFGPNVYAGYILDRIVYTDSALSTYKNGTEYNSLASHVLSNDDLVEGATINWSADGGPTIAATDWVQYRVRTTSPNGVGVMFTYGTAISPTDAVVADSWSATDKAAGVTLSNGNLTAFGNIGSGTASARAVRAYGTGKYYHELHMTNSNCYASIADSSAVLTNSPTIFGGPTNPHEAFYWKSGYTDYNGASPSGYPTFTDGDGVDVAYDGTAKKVWFRVAAADGATAGSWIPSGDPASGTGGLDVSAMTGSPYPTAALGSNGSQTARFTGFTRTPPSGFVAP